MTTNFRLTSDNNQYNEFVFGTDSFILKTRYNSVNNRYYLDVYKNGRLVLRSLKLVWSLYNLFSSYGYKGLGELNCISEEFNIIETNQSKRQVFQELTKDNITKFVFNWSYDV